MMKAIVLSNYGSPDQLELKDLEKPIPKEGEVLVKIHATTINDWDWCLVRGTPFYIRLLCGWRKPNISVPGAEIAGRVEIVGQNVTQFQPGDAVYGDLSECGFGGFAEYVCVPEMALAQVPDGTTLTEAAAIPHAAMLAVQGLIDAGQLQPGQKLLINGGGGGVGTLGVQIARTLGVEEITGVDHANKFALMRSLGFTHTIDYTQTDFTTSPEQYDLILDTKTNPGSTSICVRLSMQWSPAIEGSGNEQIAHPLVVVSETIKLFKGTQASIFLCSCLTTKGMKIKQQCHGAYRLVG